MSVNVVSCEYVSKGSYSVGPEGDIYLCPASAGRPEYRIGVIRKGGTEWFSSYYHMLTRDPSLASPCMECEMLPMCGGGCTIASHFAYQDYHKAYCNFTKELTYERLKAHLMAKYPEKFGDDAR